MKLYKVLTIIAIAAAFSLTLWNGCSVEKDQGLLIYNTFGRSSTDCSWDNTVGQFGGSYDVAVGYYEDTLSYYSIGIHLENTLSPNAVSIRQRPEGNDITLRYLKFSYEVPEGWAGVDIPDYYYDLRMTLAPLAKEYLMGVDMINKTVIDTLKKAYKDQASNPNVIPDVFQPLLVKIEAFGENTAGQEITSNTYYFRLYICYGCTIAMFKNEYITKENLWPDKAAMQVQCCNTPYNSADATTYASFLISYKNFAAGSCSLYQDRIQLQEKFPCSWMKGCYAKLSCDSCFCDPLLKSDAKPTSCDPTYVEE